MTTLKFVAFGIVVIVSLLVGFVILDPAQAVGVYKFCAYPITLLTFGILILALIRSPWSKKHGLRSLFSGKMLPVLVVFAVTTAVFLKGTSWGFKIVLDEPLIVGVSQSLHYDRTPLFGWRAYNIEGVFTITDSYLDKRPIPFSVLISFLHDLTGYRVENAFIVNGVIGVASIMLIGLLGFGIHGRLGACLGMLLLGGLPTFIHYSHGAGFDVFNVFMVMVVLLLGLKWYKDSSSWSLVAFVFAGVILCQSRYESSLFALPIGLTVLYKWWRDRTIQLPWLLIAVPVIMTLIPLHQSVFKLNEGFWELKSIPTADQIFGFKYFYPNLGHAMNFFWDWTDIYPNSPILSCIGVLSFAILIAKVGRRIVAHLRYHPELFVWVVFSFGLVIHFLLTMMFFYGQLDSPMLHRISLPIYLLAVFLSIACLRVLPSNWIKQAVLLSAFISLWAYTVPVTAKEYYGNSYIPQLYNSWIREFVHKNQDKDYLIIDENPIPWIIYNVSAATNTSVNGHPDKIQYQLKRNSFDDILAVVLVTEDPKSGGNYSIGKTALSAGFKKKFISRKRLHPFYFVDLYRLVDVDVEVVNAENAEKAAADDPFSGDDIETESFEFSEENKARQKYYINLP